VIVNERFTKMKSRIKQSSMWLAVISLMAGMMSMGVASANGTTNASTRLASVTGDLATVNDPNTAGGVAQYYNANVGFKRVWVTAGEAFTLVFNVDDANGVQAAAGTSVTLKAGTGYSNSNAELTYTPDSGTATNFAGNGENDAASFPGTVDANGQVSFTFTNTNVDADVAAGPADVTTSTAGTTVYSNFLLEYAGGGTSRTGTDTLDTDIVSVGFVKAELWGQQHLRQNWYCCASKASKLTEYLLHPPNQ
jgi:hypothetical protein